MSPISRNLVYHAGLVAAVAGCRGDAGQGSALGPAVTRPPPEVAAGVRLERIARGLAKPVDVDQPPGETLGRLYITEQVGRVRLWSGGEVVAAPVLDLTGSVSTENWEQGLLGLEFHPRFAENRKLYVNYTDRAGDTRVVEYRMDATATRVDPDSARELLRIDQPYGNHNGGHLAFGPDGKLWIGTGDGGAANDPHGNGQNPETLLGKMLVLDADAPGAAPEVRFLGLRNPWRYAFDRATGDLYIADVGQNQWEWVHVIPRGELATPGLNLGWNIVEGSHCFRERDCKKVNLRSPVLEYDHDTGCSITGGFVYRGAALPALQGHYFYADFCTAIVRSFRRETGAHHDWRPSLDPKHKLAKISAFGEDAAGELYLVSLEGSVYKLVP